MGRVPQKPAEKGSQKWLQVIVNERPKVFDEHLRVGLGLAPGEQITWLSPLKHDDYAEYSDKDFLRKLHKPLPTYPLAKFWPRRGPQWDALAKAESGKVLLVEAKAHIAEMVSSPTGASPDSLTRIKRSLEETKTFLRSKNPADWCQTLYQYTNRLAHLYLLRQLNGIPAYLVFVYFLNDPDMKGPRTQLEWEPAITLAKGILGIQNHRLSPYVVDVFIDIEELR